MLFKYVEENTIAKSEIFKNMLRKKENEWESDLRQIYFFLQDSLKLLLWLS